MSLAIEGPAAAGIAGEADNLVLKAARLLADRAGVAPRAAIRLAKHIPVAAGLGGGSADAAAALHALVDLWRVAMPVEELFDIAATLGADVPMCLAGRAALASGVGEILRPAPPLPPCAILLVNPGAPLATPRGLCRASRRVLGCQARAGGVAGSGRTSSLPWPHAATISPPPRSRCGRRSPTCWTRCARAMGCATPR